MARGRGINAPACGDGVGAFEVHLDLKASVGDEDLREGLDEGGGEGVDPWPADGDARAA